MAAGRGGLRRPLDRVVTSLTPRQLLCDSVPCRSQRRCATSPGILTFCEQGRATTGRTGRRAVRAGGGNVLGRSGAAATRNPGCCCPRRARLKSHGLHLPLNNDWLIAAPGAPGGGPCRGRRAADRAIELLSGAAGISPEPSTSSWRPPPADRDICRSLARHGAKRFYVLNTGVSADRPSSLPNAVWRRTASRSHSIAGATSWRGSRPIGRAGRRQPRRRDGNLHDALYIAPQLVAWPAQSRPPSPPRPRPPHPRSERHHRRSSPTGA